MTCCEKKLLDCREKDGPFAKCVCDADPDRACEAVSVSSFSPGPVVNEEEIARFIEIPVHGSLLDGSFSPNDSLFQDLLSHGLSCVRISYENETRIHERGNEHAAQKSREGKLREYFGFAKLKVSFLRSLECDGGLRVYDTASEEFRSHAEALAYPPDKRARKTLLASLVHYVTSGADRVVRIAD